MHEQSVCNVRERMILFQLETLLLLKTIRNYNFWKLAMVENLLRGDDDMVHTAVKRVVGGKGDQHQRLPTPIQHLIPMEV